MILLENSSPLIFNFTKIRESLELIFIIVSAEMHMVNMPI